MLYLIVCFSKTFIRQLQKFRAGCHLKSNLIQLLKLADKKMKDIMVTKVTRPINFASSVNNAFLSWEEYPWRLQLFHMLHGKGKKNPTTSKQVYSFVKLKASWVVSFCIPSYIHEVQMLLQLRVLNMCPLQEKKFRLPVSLEVTQASALVL